MPHNSMRGRLTAAFTLALATTLALACAGLMWYARYTEERSADSVLAMAATTVRQEFTDEAAARNPAAFLAQESEELRRSGLTVSVFAPGRRTALTGTPAAEHTNPARGTRSITLTIGGSAMSIGVPWRSTEARLRHQSLALVALALLACTAGAAGAWFLVGRTLQPIGVLAQKADETRADPLTVRLQAPSSDAEIAYLVATLNGLLGRLSHAAATQARFYSAASHELRTPLHTLSGHLEVGLSRQRSNEEYRSTLEEAYRQTSRLSSLVQNLLLLTRLNTTPEPPPSEAVDLRAVVENTLQQLRTRIEERCLRVELSPTASAEIVAPPIHVEIVVRNLLENAVKYATRGGAISVGIPTVRDSTQLTVQNDSPPVANARQLIEPFYRPDGSRHSETGGTGLGLAICDAIARANGWDLTLRAEAGLFCVEANIPHRQAAS